MKITQPFKYIAQFFTYSDKELTLFKCLKYSQPRHWRSTALGTFVTVILSVVPAIAAAIVLSLASFAYDWKGFIQNGEVPIFCVGLFSTSILLTAKELKAPFAHRQTFAIVGILGVILAMACYAGSCVAAAQARTVAFNKAIDNGLDDANSANTTATLVSQSNDTPRLIIILSIILYAYTIVFSAVVEFVDQVREDLPEKLVAEAVEALNSTAEIRQQFQSLSEEEANG